MGGISKALTFAVAWLSIATILVVSFAWIGPGREGMASSASAAVLFDEEQVRRVYARVSPAVVELHLEDQFGSSYVQQGFGSGFLIDKEGHIATNNHVIQDSDRVRVTFPGGTTVEAKVLGRSPPER